MSDAKLPPGSRAAAFDFTALPVPYDALVYTDEEWSEIVRQGRRFARTAAAEAVWVYSRGGADAGR